MIKVGSYEVHAVECEYFGLDGGGMFGIVPKAIWEKRIACDSKNRIALSSRSMLISTADRKILVDVGVGQKFSEKMRQIYNVSGSSLEKNLKTNVEIGVEDITDVILTHFHFDHVGGATKLLKEKLVPTFPNATYYVQAEHFEWAKGMNIRERASFMPENYMPLYEAGKLKLLDGKTELLPGLELIPTYGHTVAMQIVKLSSENKTIAALVDVVPTLCHVPLHYVMAFDLYPMKTMEEKKNFLTQAIDENWVLFSVHDVDHQAFKVKKTDKGFEIAETVSM